MKKYLNTLFVTTQGAWLAKKGETLVVKIEQRERLRIPMVEQGLIIAFRVAPRAGAWIETMPSTRENKNTDVAFIGTGSRNLSDSLAGFIGIGIER